MDRKLIESVLAAEIMGHYRSYQVLGRSAARCQGSGRSDAARACSESMEKETERIFRLLKILYPQTRLHSAYVGLQSPIRSCTTTRVEFMDSVLPPEIAQLIIPLFDRDVTSRRASSGQPDARAHRSAIAKKRSR